MYFFSKIIKSCDLFGVQILLNYKKSSYLKTHFGGVLSIALAISSILLFYVFGEEIFYRSKPLTRFSKISRNDSVITLEEFPLFFTVTTFGLTSNDSIEDFITFLAMPKHTKTKDPLSDLNSTLPSLKITRCNNENNLTKYNNFLKTTTFNPNETFCVVSPNNSNFYNDNGSYNSTLITVYAIKCMKQLNRNCKSNEEISNKIKSLYLNFYYIDVTLDYDNYLNPLNRELKQLKLYSTSSETKRFDIQIKNTDFESDRGLITEELDRYSYPQVADVQGESHIIIGDWFMYVEFSSPRMGDHYRRDYLKLTDFAAKLGGILNVLFIVGSYLCRVVSDTAFYLQQAKDLVNFEALEKSEKKLWSGTTYAFSYVGLHDFNSAPINVGKNDPGSLDNSLSNKVHPNIIKVDRIQSCDNFRTRFAFNQPKIEEEEVNDNKCPSECSSNIPVKTIVKTELTEIRHMDTKTPIMPNRKQSNISVNFPVPTRRKSSKKADQMSKVNYILEGVKNAKVNRIKKENIGSCNLIATYCTCSKDDSNKKFYAALIQYFEDNLSILNITRNKLDLELIKFILLGDREDFKKLFQTKIPIEEILNKYENYSYFNETINESDEAEYRNQHYIRSVFDKLQEAFSQRELFK